MVFVRKLVAIETNVPAREIFRLRGHDRCVWCAPVWKHTRWKSDNVIPVFHLRKPPPELHSIGLSIQSVLLHLTIIFSIKKFIFPKLNRHLIVRLHLSVNIFVKIYVIFEMKYLNNEYWNNEIFIIFLNENILN